MCQKLPRLRFGLDATNAELCLRIASTGESSAGMSLAFTRTKAMRFLGLPCCICTVRSFKLRDKMRQSISESDKMRNINSDNLRQSISDNNCHRADNLRHTREEIAALIPPALLAVETRDIAAVHCSYAFCELDVYISGEPLCTLKGDDYSTWQNILIHVNALHPQLSAPKRRAIAAAIYLELV